MSRKVDGLGCKLKCRVDGRGFRGLGALRPSGTNPRPSTTLNLKTTADTEAQKTHTSITAAMDDIEMSSKQLLQADSWWEQWDVQFASGEISYKFRRLKCCFYVLNVFCVCWLLICWLGAILSFSSPRLNNYCPTAAQYTRSCEEEALVSELRALAKPSRS